ncbi:MAG TPA: cytochrome C oxidase Cbb3, partial [Acidobacteria bacterium]|nr:cytochrome C oxidase Cbb3 [Acidobacteriota bacterium]
MNVQMEPFVYDDKVVRKFVLATVVWGIVGMLAGLLAALQLADPLFNFEIPWITFGRLRP